MPNVVTFDTDRLLIIEIPVFAGSPEVMQDNVTSMQEIYSEWKELLANTAGSPSTGSLGFPPAIRQVGGDPITDTQDLGITYFVTNGWRMKPAEGNHKWTVDGNVWTDPAGQSVFAFTDGAFNVNTETKVSNLVDSSVARLDLVQLLNAVWIDTVNGISGTAEGIGTPTNPVNNVVDARTIADRDNLRAYKLRGTISLPVAHTDWLIEGIGAREASIVDFNGQSVAGTRLVNCELTGSAANTEFDASFCSVDLATAISGHFDNCGFHSSFQLGTNSRSIFSSCYSEVPSGATPICDWNGATEANWRDWSGGLEIQNMGSVSPLTSPEPTASVDLDPGTLIMGPTNIGGALKVRGIGELYDTTGSPSTSIDSSELLKGSDLQTTRKLAQNRTHTDPNTGIMTVFDDNDVDVFKQGDLFEDVAATQPYRGQGAERRNRLT